MPEIFIRARTGKGYDLMYRSLIYDAKNDLLPFLHRMGLSESREIILTNPFDQRSCAWNVAADITTVADAESFAGIIVTADESNTDRFWEFASREIVSGVVSGLINAAPENWDLRDIVHVTADDPLLLQILQKSRAGKVAASDGGLATAFFAG